MPAKAYCVDELINADYTLSIRFKFVQGSQTAIVPRVARATPSSAPSNEKSHLTSALIGLLDPSVGIEVNLLFNFGGFIVDIPRRLGSNAALDATSDAFVASFTGFRSGRREPDTKVLRLHGKALKALRSCLEERTTAQAPETLCAIQLIMIYQSFLGTTSCVSHSTGVAQILKSRGFAGPRNTFEEVILLAQRGSVVVEALTNDKVTLTKRQWTELVTNKLDTQSLDGQLLHILAQVPDLMQRARSVMKSKTINYTTLSQLREEAKGLCDNVLPFLGKTRAYLDENDLSLLSIHHGPQYGLLATHAFRLRSYGWALTVSIIVYRVAESLDLERQKHKEQLHYLAQEIIKVAECSGRYRPLGSMYLILSLSAAHMATDNITIQASSVKWLEDYRTDFSAPKTKPLTTEMTWLRERFLLRERRAYDEIYDSVI